MSEDQGDCMAEPAISPELQAWINEGDSEPADDLAVAAETLAWIEDAAALLAELANARFGSTRVNPLSGWPTSQGPLLERVDGLISRAANLDHDRPAAARRWVAEVEGARQQVASARAEAAVVRADSRQFRLLLAAWPETIRRHWLFLQDTPGLRRSSPHCACPWRGSIDGDPILQWAEHVERMVAGRLAAAEF